MIKKVQFVNENHCLENLSEIRILTVKKNPNQSILVNSKIFK